MSKHSFWHQPSSIHLYKMQQNLCYSFPILSINPSNYYSPSARRIKFKKSITSSSLPSSLPSNLQSEFLPNASCRLTGGFARGFSLGVDIGNARTGIAITKGFSFRPLSVLELKGQKLELRLLDIAENEEVVEFIIGLPRSHDGKETPQSNKVRSIAGRFAVRAAERGMKVFLQDEYGSTVEALDFMITKGVKKYARQGRIDAYSAVMILERYYSMSGSCAELVLPKQPELQERLLKGPDWVLNF